MAHPNVLKVMLPESKENKAKEAKQNVQVAMDANEQLFYENKPCSAEDLERKLELVHQKDSTIAVSLQMDKTLPIQKLVEVMEIGKRQQVSMFLKTTKPQ
jgi:biopolymer transport protein ExbD